MHSKLIACAAAVLVAVGGTWAYSHSAAKSDCCYPGSPCCYPGSPCCDDCCAPGSPCCDPGSPCCDTADCCALGLPCCNPASDCCLSQKAAPNGDATVKVSDATAPAGNCCAR